MRSLACLMTLALAAPSFADDARTEAATRFDRGVKLYEAHDYAAALAEFEAADRLMHRPQLLYNIGVTQKKLFRYNDAVVSLRRYLDEGGAAVPADRRAEVERELAEVRALVAEVTVTVAGAPAVVSVDGRSMGTTPLAGPLLLAAGAHALRATRAGCDPAEQAVSVVSGEKIAVTLAPKPMTATPTTARLTLTTRPSGGELVIDGHARGREPWAGSVEPGGHDVRATLPGHHVARQELMLSAGQERAVVLELVPLPPPAKWYRRWYTWTAVAVVVAAAVGGGVGGYYATRPTYDKTINFPP